MSYPIKPLVLCLAALASTATAFPALAQNSSIEEVIITANRIPVPLRQVGASVAVLTELDLQAHGNAALTDILRQLPAIGSSGNGGAGKPTSLRIRGEEGFRTLTIFDGIRLSDPSGPQIGPQLEHLMSSGIGRVEVLRGPQGLSYGADAGGVVNLFSQHVGKGMSATVNAEAGRYGTQQYDADVGGGNQQGDFFLSTARYKTTGFNATTADPTQDNDGYENTTLHGRVGVNFNEHWRADLVHHDIKSENQYDGCFLTTPVYDCQSFYKFAATRGALAYQSETFSHSLSYTTSDIHSDNLAEGLATFATQGGLKRWEYLGSARQLPGVNLVFGADYEKARTNARERGNTGYYLEALSDFSQHLFLTAGVRYDHNDDFGANNAYRVSGAYRVDLTGGSLKFKTSYGTGFRAPSPFEIEYNHSASAFPPASQVNLAQEKSRGIEAGVEYFTDQGVHLEAVYFDQTVEDAIFFDLAGFSGYLQDRGSSHSRGAEFNGQFTVAKALDLTFNYTYNDAKQPKGLPRLRRPRHLANLGLTWRGFGDKLSANAFYRSSRNSYDSGAEGMAKLDDFAVLDLSLSYALSKNISVYGRLENALDERYQEVLGYNTAGAAAYLGIRLHMRD
ncbi:MAG: TonB-dependent receptor [Pseudomonadales bacterium]|jgi:vitamin B12 transporter|nr:TonB-dependent receptor [Pseudomonadales bacterium]